MRTLVALLAAATLLFSAAPSFAQDASTVTCKDGTSAKAGRGACSHHGGVNKGASTASPTTTPAAPAAPSNSKAPSSSTATAEPAPAPAPQPSTKSTHTPTATTGSSKAANTDPNGATAQCKDGSYSHAKHHTGACSHHGGVAKWLDQG